MHGFNIFGFEVNTYYTEVLAKYMAGLKFEVLPKEAVEQAKLFTLRIVGGALEASGTAPAAGSPGTSAPRARPHPGSAVKG